MNGNLTGLVFDIKRFAIHDGPGIRTTVFLKGCELSCPWCHNPESRDREPEISFITNRCIGCGYCVTICPEGCHAVGKDGHTYQRDHCRRCGLCAKDCPSHALEIVGQKMSVATVMTEVMKDMPFYTTSEGGMTISGGEPMDQFEFTRALLALGKSNGLHTCLDTNGHAPLARHREIATFVDIFLYDIKETDPALYKEHVGGNLTTALENLQGLDETGAMTVLRCPVIPGWNDRDDHFERIGKLASGLANVIEINVQPYHPLGESKANRLGSESGIANLGFPADEAISDWVKRIQSHTTVAVRRS